MLAQGGFGMVYSSNFKHNDKEIVIKILKWKSEFLHEKHMMEYLGKQKIVGISKMINGFQNENGEYQMVFQRLGLSTFDLLTK